MGIKLKYSNTWNSTEG